MEAYRGTKPFIGAKPENKCRPITASSSSGRTNWRIIARR
jgi:hypothetical protein